MTGPDAGATVCRRTKSVRRRAGAGVAAAQNRVLVTLACGECKRRNYHSEKNKKNTSGRLELRKYCRWCRVHTVHRETR